MAAIVLDALVAELALDAGDCEHFLVTLPSYEIYLKYFKSGAFWPLRAGIRWPSALK